MSSESWQKKISLINGYSSRGKTGHLMQWASKFQPRHNNIAIGNDYFGDEENHITREVIAALEEGSMHPQPVFSRDSRAVKEGADYSSGLRVGDGRPAATTGRATGKQGELTVVKQDDDEKSAYLNSASQAKIDYFNEICEKVWRSHDQKLSFLLQDKLKTENDEFYPLVTAIDINLEKLMVHRFGNFLVQKRLEVATSDGIVELFSRVEGRMAELSQNQFCCHVIQKILDVSPLIIQAKIMAEMLEMPIETMSSPFGTHVWQKLFYLTWSKSLPPIVLMVNNAVHLCDEEGWVKISQSESGCSAIKSFLGIAVSGPERQSCVDEIVKNITNIIKLYAGFSLVSRVVFGTSTRSKAISMICADAINLARHPVASSNLVQLLNMKIPSFPSRLALALAPESDNLKQNKYAEQIIRSLKESK